MSQFQIDDGLTSFHYRRVDRSHPYNLVNNHIDELSARIGLIAVKHRIAHYVKFSLERIILDLRLVMSEIAVLEEDRERFYQDQKNKVLSEDDAIWLQKLVTDWELQTQDKGGWVSGSESELVGDLNLARVVARRADACVSMLVQHFQRAALLRTYLNDISDLLFRMALYYKHTTKEFGPGNPHKK